MPRQRAAGEMPFLDHLEELRWRILWSLLALVVGVVLGFYLVQEFNVLGLIKRPIEPFLPEGQLFVTRPTDAFFITLKLAVMVGLVLAAPVILAQVWAFVAPALYEHERRFIIPTLIAGSGLFVVGVVMAYLWVLPAALKFLLMFQREDLQAIITANEYVVFAVQLMVAFGLVFELPLVMVLLSAFGLVEPRTFARQRPLALVFASIVAALVTPPDVVSMMLMLAPLWVLYEAGIVVGRLVAKKAPAIGAAAVLLVLAGAGTTEGAAQDPPPAARRPDTLRTRRDSLTQPLDTSAARKLGLPSAPSRRFPDPDSVIQALMQRAGYAATRYAGDSISLYGASREIVLVGSALVGREGTTLEADEIIFQESECRLTAEGSPALFDRGTVLVGEGMRYDTCERRGVVARALTSFQQSGVTWYLTGGIAMDSASVRVYGKSNDITSCDLPDPHYHFAASNVKWVTNTIMVARPAVLYVRDVPILWLPFIFQDMSPGRRTGILVPRFGVSDLIRPNEGYRRHISNVGFYVALNDYTDVQFSLDWFSGNYLGFNGQLRYRWLDRFVQGGLAVSRIYESAVEGQGGSRSLRLQWNHQQSFDQRTRLSADVDYATSARVVQRNSVDPFLQTATLGSRVNFSKQFRWGTLTAGGSLSQDLSNGGTTASAPTFSLTPSPIDIGESITWSPSLSVTNNLARNQGPPVLIPLPPVNGMPMQDSVFPGSRNTSIAISTPLRVGRWNWQNSISITDTYTDRPQPALVLPDPSDPADSITRYYGEDFQTGIDWNTGINLPSLFSATWKVQPSLGIRNVTGGPFLLRNRFSGGAFVSQGKRLAFGASMSPTLFGFFPGFGPLDRIRHAISPQIGWSYSPSATIAEEYARAIDPTGRQSRTSPPLHTISLGLSQTFEAKLDPPPGDTAGTQQPRKIKLLSVQTSSLQYDLEQAKVEGRNGWRSQTLSNTLTSDLLPGFSLSMTHDLWDGPVGYDTTRFDPFLSSLSARFGLSSRTFASIFSLFTGKAQPADAGPEENLIDPVQPEGTGTGQTIRLDPVIERQQGPRIRRGRGLQASVNYELSRRRPIEGALAGTTTTPRDNQNLGLTFGFSPTPNWSASWSTQYNITTGEFGQHVLRLDRDLHRWRATFAFTKAPNGNFAFNFFIALTDEPDIKFQYDQRTVNR
jgi:Tat protein translocase TatC